MSSQNSILLVDDEKQFTDAISRVLNMEGYEVKVTNSAKFALQEFESGSFDLVISDLSMPGMDGIQFIREIRNKNAGQKIIVVTAFPSQRSQEQAFKLGTLSYIVKPFQVKRFLELVRESLQEKREGLLGPVKLKCEDLIQLYGLMNSSVVLEIENGEKDEEGTILFRKGEVVHAQTDNNQGLEAFYEIQAWKFGRFRSKPLTGEITQTIDQNLGSLLLEGARRIDVENSNSSDRQN